MTWTLVFTRQAQKDARRLSRARLRPKAETLLELLRRNPFESPTLLSGHSRRTS